MIRSPHHWVRFDAMAAYVCSNMTCPAMVTDRDLADSDEAPLTHPERLDDDLQAALDLLWAIKVAAARALVNAAGSVPHDSGDFR